MYPLVMSTLLEQHMARLKLIWLAILASILFHAGIPLAVPVPGEAAGIGIPGLAWILGALAAVNLATIAPLRRIMIERARQRAAREGRPETLLAAHQAASITAWARVELVAMLGLAVLLTSGRADIFWAFLVTAAAAMLALYPKAPSDRNLAPGEEAGRQALEP
jgi:hypothetical protein